MCIRSRQCVPHNDDYSPFFVSDLFYLTIFFLQKFLYTSKSVEGRQAPGIKLQSYLTHLHSLQGPRTHISFQRS